MVEEALVELLEQSARLLETRFAGDTINPASKAGSCLPHYRRGRVAAATVLHQRRRTGTGEACRNSWIVDRPAP